jgi:hypothetical protein
LQAARFSLKRTRLLVHQTQAAINSKDNRGHELAGRTGYLADGSLAAMGFSALFISMLAGLAVSALLWQPLRWWRRRQLLRELEQNPALDVQQQAPCACSSAVHSRGSAGMRRRTGHPDSSAR